MMNKKRIPYQTGALSALDRMNNEGVKDAPNPKTKP